EGSGDLTGTVRAEVKEYHGILVRNNGNRLSVLFDDGRKYELVGLVCVIGCLYRLGCVCAFYAFAFGKGLVGKLHTVPSVVSVHSVITAGNHADLAYADLFHLGFKLFD